MKYIRQVVLVIGLLLLLVAGSIMFQQTFGAHEPTAEPVYVQDLPKYITTN